MKQHEPFYIYFYVLVCPKGGTPIPYVAMTGFGQLSDMPISCATCDWHAHVKAQGAVYSHTVTYQDKKCSPLRKP